MTALWVYAESAGQAVQDWRVVGILAVTGIITLLIRQRHEGRQRKEESNRTEGKVDQLDGKVTEVVDQVTNSGSNLAEEVGKIKSEISTGVDDNMRAEVSEGLKLMRFAVSHIENLPTSDDIKRLDGRIDVLGRRMSAVEGRKPT